MDIENINSSINKNNNRHGNNTVGEDGYVAARLPMHSQVMNIKKEFEKIHHPSSEQLEVRRVLRKLNRQRSRSPLGLAKKPISVAE